MRANFENPKNILCFNSFKKLVAIFSSYREVEKMTGYKHSCIQRACTGAQVAAFGYYWRELDPETILESDDLMKVNLAQYDLGVMGKDRIVYKTAEMKRGAETCLISKLAKKLNS